MKLTLINIQMHDRSVRQHLCGVLALYINQSSVSARYDTREKSANRPPGEEDRHCRSVFLAPRKGVGTRSNRRAGG